MAVSVPPDTPCYHCQYNLQGLDPSSNCPECGRPISLTLTFALEHADRNWVRRQARTMLLLIAVPMFHRIEWSYFERSGYEWINFGVNWLIVAVAVWACWRLSVPEPGRDPGDAQSAMSRGLRVCILAYAAVMIAVPFWDTFQQYWLVIAYVGLAALLVADWLILRLLLLLAVRCGRQSLAAHARIVMWALPILAGVKSGVLLLRYPLPPGLYYAISAAALWGSLVMVLLWVALLGRIYEVLRLVADGRWDSRPQRASADASPYHVPFSG